MNHNGSLDSPAGSSTPRRTRARTRSSFRPFSRRNSSPRTRRRRIISSRNGAGESQFAMLKRLELDRSRASRTHGHAAARGIHFPLHAVRRTERRSARSARAAGLQDSVRRRSRTCRSSNTSRRKGQPIILSTGMSTLDEVAAAVAAIRGAGEAPLALLHCVSNYPAEPVRHEPPRDANHGGAFDVPVGYLRSHARHRDRARRGGARAPASWRST